MKRKATLFATLLTGLLVASAVQASPFLLFDQLFGMGAPDASAVPFSFRKQFKKGNATVTALPFSVPFRKRRLLNLLI